MLFPVRHIRRSAILLLCGLIISLLLVACGGGGTSSATPTPKPTPTPVSLTTYTGDGYTINFPQGWKATKSESTGAVTFADPVGIYNLSIAVTPNPGGAASKENLADAAATGAKSKLKNPKDETIAPTTTVGGDTWSQRAVS